MTETGGECSVFSADANSAISGDDLTVNYLQDGDETTLHVKDDSLLMSRRGRESSMFAEFRRDSDAVLCLTFGESRAEIPVRTVAFQKLQKREDFYVALDYELRVPENSQFFSLKIFIQGISEEK